MSNKRKKGKISEDLTREYVSLNHIIATKGRNEEFGNRFSKIKTERVLVNMNTAKKCVSFFYLEKCANFRKMSISEGYFIQLKPNFSMCSPLWLVLYAVV